MSRALFAVALVLAVGASPTRSIRADEMNSAADTAVAPVAGDGGGAGCGTADGDCGCANGVCHFEKRRQSYWFAGTEVTFMSADVTTGGRTTLSLSDTTAPGVATFSTAGGNELDDFTFTPRIWVGRKFGEKWAVVSRFWQLSASQLGAPTPITATGTNFATFTEVGRADLYDIDIEAVRTMTLGKWTFDGSLGARYARFRAEGSLGAFGVFTTGNFLNLQYETRSKFDGVGLTGGLTGRRQIGNSPFYLYLGGRASRLDGSSFSLARAAGTVVDNPSIPLSGAATVTRDDDEALLMIGEIQGGLECEFELSFMPARAFIRAGVEYQHWNISARPVGGAGFGGTIGELTTNSFSSANHGDAELVGFTFGTGLTW